MSNPRIQAWVADLYFVSRIESVAKQLGLELELIGSVREVPNGNILKFTDGKHDRLILVDLNNGLVPWEEWIPILKQDPETNTIPIMAFGSHRDIPLMQTAKSAGVDQVLAKSRFTEDMPNLIRKAAGLDQT
jgi:CheY-like chemotaxis protein